MRMRTLVSLAVAAVLALGGCGQKSVNDAARKAKDAAAGAANSATDSAAKRAESITRMQKQRLEIKD